MSSGEIESVVKETLKHLSESFCKKEGELAYLALTSKPELPFRDHLAFELHQRLKQREFLVAREWTPKGKRRRIDIAILRDGEPEVLIEVKTWSLFTFIKDSVHHFRAVRKDIKKCRKVSRKSSAYALILAAYIDSLPDERYEGVMKYRSRPNGGWEKAFAFHKTSNGIKKQARQAIDRVFSKWMRSAEGEIQAGEVFDAKASVLYWLFKGND